MIKRQNPEITASLEAKLIEWRGDYEAMRELSTLKDDPRWGRLRTIIEANLENVNMRLDEFVELPDKKRDFLLAQRVNLGWFKGMVDNAQDQMEELSTKIKDTEKALAERNAKRITAPPPS